MEQTPFRIDLLPQLMEVYNLHYYLTMIAKEVTNGHTESDVLKMAQPTQGIPLSPSRVQE